MKRFKQICIDNKFNGHNLNTVPYLLMLKAALDFVFPKATHIFLTGLFIAGSISINRLTGSLSLQYTMTIVIMLYIKQWKMRPDFTGANGELPF